jgi:hypothetical protein
MQLLETLIVMVREESTPARTGSDATNKKGAAKTAPDTSRCRTANGRNIRHYAA